MSQMAASWLKVRHIRHNFENGPPQSCLLKFAYGLKRKRQFELIFRQGPMLKLQRMHMSASGCHLRRKLVTWQNSERRLTTLSPFHYTHVFVELVKLFSGNNSKVISLHFLFLVTAAIFVGAHNDIRHNS